MPRASRPGRASSPAPPAYLLFSRPRARHPPNPSAATASCRTPHTHRAPISPSRFKTKSPAAVTLLRPQLRPLLPSGVPNLLRRPLTSHTPNLSLPSRVRSMASPALISDTDQWKALQAHVGAIHLTHLRDLMADADRCKAMTTEFEGVYLDYSRQQATTKTIDKLFELAKAAKLEEKIDKMFSGEKINTTENRSSARSLESAKTLTTPARLLQAMLPPAEP